jgi:phosphoribosylaminoimidazole-succinocarboxamide synthase
MALFWFELLGMCPEPPDGRRPLQRGQARRASPGGGPLDAGQALKPLPVEAVVRGYLAGSGWKEYQDNGEPCAA